MNSFVLKKVTFILLLFCSPFAVFPAGNATSSPVSDTLVFSLFVVAAIVFLIIIYAQISAVKSILENKDLWTNQNKSNSKKVTVASILVLSLILSGHSVYAAGGNEPVVTMTRGLYWILISIDAFLLGIIITLHFMIKGVIRAMRGEEEVEQDPLTQLATDLTGAVPIERESEILLDHNYDGIRELDNNLPPWWIYGFYITIIFSGIYLVRYHITGSGELQLEEYATEMAEAKVQIDAYLATQANLVDESSLEVLSDPSRLEDGKKVFMDNCKICHGQFGEGQVGPNLTDIYWKNGGGIRGIYHTIKTGVPDKGMISWEGQLTPGQIHEVASYIVTLEGSNPPNAKGPEGEPSGADLKTDTTVQSEEMPVQLVEEKI